MLSVGHHLGLFDTMAPLPPSTSEQIAAAAGLNARYVREWLAALVTGRVVDYDAPTRTYFLPPERAACLTRAAGPNNLALIATAVPQFGVIEERILECFRNGGGVPFEAQPRYQQFIAELSGATYNPILVDVILRLVPGLTERLEAGIDVADIGRGFGGAVARMAAAFPASRFTGYDASPHSIGRARAAAESAGLANARFVEQDAATLGDEASCDLIMALDSIHDQARPRTVLRNIARMPRPGGVFLMADMRASSNLEDNLEHPIAPALYTVSTFHCMTVSLARGGEGLGTMWGEQRARALLAEAGLAVNDVRQIEGDFLSNYFICSRA
jgi:SAM-dependent methyltransferase